ncbi:MAG: PorP/SprF family type IX secretion system membrane protein [Bacteroidales bacterium]|nr:PorP/SprF family type IX secretion system membrane protein [Bacteroidales bacterium]
MRRIIFTILLILTVNSLDAQQDPQVSHYFFMKEFYNPAYAGYDGEICANFLSHQQWRGFENAPFTNMLTLDTDLPSLGIQSLDNAGIGINFVNDQYGFVTDFRGNISLSYNFDLPIGSLRIGLSPGAFSKKFEAQWKFPDQTETIMTDQTNVFVFDIGGGIYYSVSNLFVSFSSFHITRPSFYFEVDNNSVGSIFLVNHYYLMAGYNLSLSNSALEITPSVFFKSDGREIQYDINIFALYNKKIWASVTYRNKDALAFFVGTSYFNNIRLGLSYDITLSYLNRVSNGTLEAYVGYCFSFIKPANAQKYRNVKTL